jgi:hypothetical protein
MKTILNVYLSFVVALAVLVGAAGFYAQGERSHYAQNDWTGWPAATRGIDHY